MPPKKDKDVPTLKGKEAEDTILAYMKKVNRPYGSADVSANLKNAISKGATQKILQQLADDNKITQKAFGKTVLFVAKQDELEAPDAERLQEMKVEYESLKEKLKKTSEHVKLLERELSGLRTEPTDDELEGRIEKTEKEVEKLEKEVEPLRNLAPKASFEEMEHMDAEWNKWRAEWKGRKKIFMELFDAMTDSITKEDKEKMEEDLGIEYDTEEHQEFEKTPLGRASVKAIKPPPKKRR